MSQKTANLLLVLLGVASFGVQLWQLHLTRQQQLG